MKQYFNDLRRLRSQYNNLLVCEKTFPGQYSEQINAIRQQIDYFLKFNLKGEQINSKIAVLKSEEWPYQWFNKIEKKHCNKKFVSKIRHNTEYQHSVNIVKCFEDYYANLYAEEPIDRRVGDMFFSGLPSYR